MMTRQLHSLPGSDIVRGAHRVHVLADLDDRETDTLNPAVEPA